MKIKINDCDCALLFKKRGLGFLLIDTEKWCHTENGETFEYDKLYESYLNVVGWSPNQPAFK